MYSVGAGHLSSLQLPWGLAESFPTPYPAADYPVEVPHGDSVPVTSLWVSRFVLDILGNLMEYSKALLVLGHVAAL